jgi:hypothetical protein
VDEVIPKGVRVDSQFRAASALAPVDYFPRVARGEILPHRAEVRGFSGNRGIEIISRDGQSSVLEDVDIVIFAVGHACPSFPFLPERIRGALGNESDGAQLFRHALLPEGLPTHLAFAMHHGFMHISTATLSAMWVGALWRGDFGANPLPSVRDMKQNVERIATWKRKYLLFEPTRAYGSSTRFHQMQDMFCNELGLTPYRKIYRFKRLILAALLIIVLLILVGQLNPLPGCVLLFAVPLFVEGLAAYSASDYRGVIDEYLYNRKKKQKLVIDSQKLF